MKVQFRMSRASSGRPSTASAMIVILSGLFSIILGSSGRPKFLTWKDRGHGETAVTHLRCRVLLEVRPQAGGSHGLACVLQLPGDADGQAAVRLVLVGLQPVQGVVQPGDVPGVGPGHVEPSLVVLGQVGVGDDEAVDVGVPFLGSVVSGPPEFLA